MTHDVNGTLGGWCPGLWHIVHRSFDTCEGAPTAVGEYQREKLEDLGPLHILIDPLGHETESNSVRILKNISITTFFILGFSFQLIFLNFNKTLSYQLQLDSGFQLRQAYPCPILLTVFKTRRRKTRNKLFNFHKRKPSHAISLMFAAKSSEKWNFDLLVDSLYPHQHESHDSTFYPHLRNFLLQIYSSHQPELDFPKDHLQIIPIIWFQLAPHCLCAIFQPNVNQGSLTCIWFSVNFLQPQNNHQGMFPARKRKQSMFRNVQREMGKNNGIAGHLGILRSFATNLTPFVDRLLCC